jgi:hypothetical protein
MGVVHVVPTAAGPTIKPRYLTSWAQVYCGSLGVGVGWLAVSPPSTSQVFVALRDENSLARIECHRHEDSRESSAPHLHAPRKPEAAQAAYGIPSGPGELFLAFIAAFTKPSASGGDIPATENGPVQAAFKSTSIGFVSKTFAHAVASKLNLSRGWNVTSLSSASSPHKVNRFRSGDHSSRFLFADAQALSKVSERGRPPQTTP